VTPYGELPESLQSLAPHCNWEWAGVAGVSWLRVNGNLAESQRGGASRCGLGSRNRPGDQVFDRVPKPAIADCRPRVTCCQAREIVQRAVS